MYIYNPAFYGYTIPKREFLLIHQMIMLRYNLQFLPMSFRHTDSQAFVPIGLFSILHGLPPQK